MQVFKFYIFHQQYHYEIEAIDPLEIRNNPLGGEELTENTIGISINKKN